MFTTCSSAGQAQSTACRAPTTATPPKFIDIYRILVWQL
jgi:hypothetical protein